jgi:hypothetical protein
MEILHKKFDNLPFSLFVWQYSTNSLSAVCEYKHKCYEVGDTWVDKDDCVTVKCVRDECGVAQVETVPYGKKIYQIQMHFIFYSYNIYLVSSIHILLFCSCIMILHYAGLLKYARNIKGGGYGSNWGFAKVQHVPNLLFTIASKLCEV